MMIQLDVKSLEAAECDIALATGAGCVSLWKCMYVNARMWAFPQIDFRAHVSASKSASLPSTPLPSDTDTLYDDD